MPKIEVSCPTCGRSYIRDRKHVNQVLRQSGKWECQGCVTTARNKAAARPIGSTRTTAKGYVFVKTDSGWVQEHRIVAEREIGRPLLATEAVHHKNESKADNSPSNLFVQDHGQHTRTHHLGAKRAGDALANIRRSFPLRKGTRLSPAQAASIRLRAAAGETQRSIAQSLRVSPMTVNRVVRGQAWRRDANHSPPAHPAASRTSAECIARRMSLVRE